VIVTPPSSNILQLSETLQLTAKTFNISNDELENKMITWKSSDNSIIAVDMNGLATAIKDGTATITASSEGIESEPIDIQVGALTQKTAILSGTSGYKAVGTATLKKNESGELILELSSDFETSFALGTFIYLSSSTSGSSTKSNGLELGEVTSNGAKTFNISGIDSSVELGTYQYIIVLCKPAGITFGTGDFGN
jgi:hypothetical protein